MMIRSFFPISAASGIENFQNFFQKRVQLSKMLLKFTYTDARKKTIDSAPLLMKPSRRFKLIAKKLSSQFIK